MKTHFPQCRHCLYKDIEPKIQHHLIPTELSKFRVSQSSKKNYWWKKFTCSHRRLPEFSTLGKPVATNSGLVREERTMLVLKANNLLESSLKDFRLILILQTVNPILFSIYRHRALTKGEADYRENLLIDICDTQDSVQQKRNFSKTFATASLEHIVRVLHWFGMEDN